MIVADGLIRRIQLISKSRGCVRDGEPDEVSRDIEKPHLPAIFGGDGGLNGCILRLRHQDVRSPLRIARFSVPLLKFAFRALGDPKFATSGAARSRELAREG